MSRAFVNEDAGKDIEHELPELSLPLPPGSRNYMTPEGANDLKAGLYVLTHEVRPSIAASAGAAEGFSAKSRLAETDRRILYLSRMLSLVEVVHPPENPVRVSFGLFVLVEDEQGSTSEWRLVGVDESDPERGTLSWTSPIARGLMGKQVGETARIALPEGERILTIRGLRAPSTKDLKR